MARRSGDFGIITAMEILLFPAERGYGGRLLWPMGMARPVLRAFSEITRNAPDELTMWANLLRFPPLSAVPEQLRGGSFISVDFAFRGSPDEAERHLLRLRTIPAMWMDASGIVAPAELGSIATAPPDSLPSSELSGLLGDLDSAAVDRLLAAVGEGSGSPLAVVQIRHPGGRARPTDIGGPADAVTEPYQLFCLGIPTSPEMSARIELTFAAVTNALDGVLTGVIAGSPGRPLKA